MKKMISMLLCAVLLSGCFPALADQLGTIDMNGVFTLTCTMPEGYSLEDAGMQEEGYYLATIVPQDNTRPTMELDISFDEMYASVNRLNDLSDADLALIEDTFSEYKVEFSYPTTNQGTRLLVAKEVQDKTDFVVFYTIYKGYEVEFVLYRSHTSGDSSISDEQIQMALDFMSNLEFVAAE